MMLNPSAAGSEEMTLSLYNLKKELQRRGEGASMQLASCLPFCTALADLYLHREYHVKHGVSEVFHVMATASRAVSVALAQHPTIVERLACLVRTGASHARAHVRTVAVVMDASDISLRVLVYLATASPVVSLALSTTEFLVDAGLCTNVAARESYARLVFVLPISAAPAWADGTMGACVAPVMAAHLEDAPEALCRLLMEAFGNILGQEAPRLGHGSCRKVIVDKLLAPNSSNVLADVYAQLMTAWMPETEALVRCFVDTGANVLMRIVGRAAKFDALAVANMGAIPVLVAALLRVDQSRHMFGSLNALCALLVCRDVAEAATSALRPHVAMLVEFLAHPNLWVARAACVAMNRMCTVAAQQAEVVATQLVMLGVFNKLLELCVRDSAAADALYLVVAVLHTAGKQWIPSLQALGYADTCEQLLCKPGKGQPAEVGRLLAAVLCVAWVPGRVPSSALFAVVLRLTQPWNGDADTRRIGRRLLCKVSPDMAVEEEWRAAAAVSTAAEFSSFTIAIPQTCSICMMEDSEGWTALPCCHLFHKDCILQWIVGAQRHTCPMCQRGIADGSAR